MNLNSNPEQEWERLINLFLENEISPDEEKRLNDILSGSPEAQLSFVRACELHSMLESEPEIRTQMRENSLPANVVSLRAGEKFARSSSESDAALAVENSAGGDFTSGRTRRRWLAAAALATLSLIGYGLMQSFSLSKRPSGAQPELTTTEETTAKPKVAHQDPETQYERAVLATLGSGSQERPRTNLKVEPSLAGEQISYNRDIRPILSDNCFSCHGPDEHGRKADLRLDTYEGATDPELAAIVPGKPEASELVARIRSQDADETMPPPESHKKLSPAQIDLLTRWVTEGAEYEQHWSFLPIKRGTERSDHPKSIDGFVDHRLEKYGLTRAPEANPAILTRRLFLDMTGLPPTPGELKTHLSNPEQDAFGKLVDELLGRPTFGEHRARYWLDAARYADTHGLHLDNYREMWPYRDWVISAFNQNMPFDQFTTEQIAGDLLTDPTQSQLVATGFNRCNVTTSEGGAIEEEFLARYAVDRVSTTSTVWMGLTTGCAQCHDHKFDPITQKDFYQLYAYFNNTSQPGMDGNTKDSRPMIRVYENDETKEEAARLTGEVAAQRKSLGNIAKAAQADFEVWLKSADPETLFDTFGKNQTFLERIGNYRREEPLNLGNVGNFQKDKPFTISFRYKLPEMGDYGRVMLLSKTDPKQNDRGWRIFVKEQSMNLEFIEQYPNRVLKRGATRRYKSGSGGMLVVTYDGSGSSQGFQLYLNHQLLTSRYINEWADTLVGDFSTDAPLLAGGKDSESGYIPVVNEIRLFDRNLNTEEVKSISERAILAGLLKKEKRSADETAKLKSFFLHTEVDTYQDALVKLSKLDSSLGQIHSNTPVTLVMNEREGEARANILARGEYDQKLEEVVPGLPSFLPELKGEFPANRLGLAQWLVHPDHPLTARVAANRIWQELFGVGLVKTSEDFGTQGENPSNPALLDYLASSLIESGWDVKALYRQIVMSETYRQSSRISEEMAKRDPENRLLARGPRFRLDAEVIRDQALHVSGILDTSMGGAGVRPYQPAGIWKTVGYSNSNTQTFFQDFGPSAEHRRSIYTFWKRTAHSPNLAIFDAPNREICIMRRERTNTPLQALVMMNDPQFVRASRYLAKRVLTEKEDRDERIDYLAVLLRGHPFTEDERRVVVNSFDQFRNIYESDPVAANEMLKDEVNDAFSISPPDQVSPSEFAAWAMVANQLLNLDESLNKN